MHNSSITPETLQWNIGASIFSARPENAARLLSWNIHLPQTTRKVLHPASLNELQGGIQVLFPFTGTISHKNLPNTWKSPNKQILPMPNNGFAQTSCFRLLHNDISSFSAELIHSEESKKYYPFNYKFKVSYKFNELSLEITLEFENLDNISLPWSPGLSFDISTPWHPGLSLSNYQINIPAKKAFTQESIGNFIKIKNYEETTSLDNPSLTNRIHTKLKSNLITLGPKGNEENITINSGLNETPITHNTVKTWQDPTNNLFRIESNMGFPNAPEHGTGLNSVLPGNKASYSVLLNLL